MNVVLSQGVLARAGWAVVKGLVSAELIDSARAWIEHVVTSEPIASTLEPDFEESPEPGARQVRRLRRLLWNDPSFWAPWLHGSGLAASMRDALGCPVSIVFHAAFLKPARTGREVRLHQDQAFWEGTYARTYTWWVALDRSHAGNGCLELFPDSYHFPVMPHQEEPDYRWHRVLASPTSDLGDPVAVEVEAGDVVVWDSHIVHRSRGNPSDEPRRALSLVAVKSGHHALGADLFELSAAEPRT